MPSAASAVNRHTLAAAAATPRFAAGQLVAFHGVAGAVARSEDLLATRALEHAERDAVTGAVVVRLCDHFEDRGSCNRGHKCRFAHRVVAATQPRPAEHLRRFPAANAVSCATDAADICSLSQGPAAARVSPLALAFAGHRGSDAQPVVSASAHFAVAIVGQSAGPGIPEFSSQPDTGSAYSGAGSSRSDRSVVTTSRGWRHAAYDAAPRSLA
eukprot:CAMPEP_0174878378 /NCGR_PEP_ID=MMETSP1114-20130205/82726_1 /TAXON_ID=312471 /ORGANISM="Neobodo designis, Strain CCAP 1951/1" /LENGTH=212 /DNA_ID=CAMNT_0016113765 /DNA_START=197 /DNA_END=835 /DNA_ORIENTATION=+